MRANLARYKVPREVDLHGRAAAQRHRQDPQARAPAALSARAVDAEGGRAAGLASLSRMAAETDEFDLAGLRLSAGEGRRLSLEVPIEPL